MPRRRRRSTTDCQGSCVLGLRPFGWSYAGLQELRPAKFYKAPVKLRQGTQGGLIAIPRARCVVGRRSPKRRPMFDNPQFHVPLVGA